MDTGNVDMAKTMAEVFSIGDINKDEKLSKVEFVQVRRIKVSQIIYLYLDMSLFLVLPSTYEWIMLYLRLMISHEPAFKLLILGYEATPSDIKTLEREENWWSPGYLLIFNV